MIALRSLLFQIAFFSATTILCFLYIPLLLLPRRWIVKAVLFWSHVVMFLLRTIVGLTWKVEGGEHLPKGGFLVASKHQSAWETIVFNIIFRDPALVMKQELSRLPLWGLYAQFAGHIAIDRKGGAAALRAMTTAARDVLAQGRPVVIFPQGTRVAPGPRGAGTPYQPGVAALYGALNVPILPVALNSGLFWQRSPFSKKPGCITVQFLPALPPQQDKRQLLADLAEKIETATAALEARV